MAEWETQKHVELAVPSTSLAMRHLLFGSMFLSLKTAGTADTTTANHHDYLPIIHGRKKERMEGKKEGRILLRF